jgi:hypothetical protein
MLCISGETGSRKPDNRHPCLSARENSKLNNKRNEKILFYFLALGSWFRAFFFLKFDKSGFWDYNQVKKGKICSKRNQIIVF